MKDKGIFPHSFMLTEKEEEMLLTARKEQDHEKDKKNIKAINRKDPAKALGRAFLVSELLRGLLRRGTARGCQAIRRGTARSGLLPLVNEEVSARRGSR